MVREEGASSLTRGIGPNVFRAILMNASQLASYVLRFFFLRCRLIYCRYDFFKAELIKTAYFKDDIFCHFTASFAAVRISIANASSINVRRCRVPSLRQYARPLTCLRAAS